MQEKQISEFRFRIIKLVEGETVLKREWQESIKEMENSVQSMKENTS